MAIPTGKTVMMKTNSISIWIGLKEALRTIDRTIDVLSEIVNLNKILTKFMLGNIPLDEK